MSESNNRHKVEISPAAFFGFGLGVGVFGGILGALGAIYSPFAKQDGLENQKYLCLPEEVRAFDSSPRDGRFDVSEIYQILKSYEIKKRE